MIAFHSIPTIILFDLHHFPFSINDDTTLLQTRTKQLLLLARIREKSGHLNSSLATLKEARDNQYRLQNRIVVEQSSSVFEQNAILAK